ncbi:vacuolar protein sorting-associated protein 8 homolog [Hydra vulgaris]|uniref:Vacuolar protein sorting-associated protein 8 homolog n=1 Tax=Hydra vulgaris TaxID=6087 RepID=A0ABM4BDB1_HYDVU
MDENHLFDFPIQESNLPTLESILNEDDNLFNFNDFNSDISIGISEANSKIDDGTYSLASITLPLPKLNINDISKNKKPRIHGSILRHVMLKKISSQMTDACDRRDAGLPSSIAVSNIIAVGMSHGLVLVFDPSDQAMKYVLGSNADGLNYGAVTSLGINVECTRLLCGYARGEITMWDLLTGNCLRIIKDAHPVGYAVLHIHFTDDPTLALFSDSSGSVYSLSFKRLLIRTAESTCFFSGSKGEVCTILPLHIKSNFKDHFNNSSLLAMATLTKLIVVNLKPTPAAIYTKKLTGPSECLPLLIWSFIISELEDEQRNVYPVLMFGRNQTIIAFRIFKVDELICFEELYSIKLNHTLVAMFCLNSKIIVTIDKFECIRTIDLNTQEELECLDISSVNLVYGSSYFKSLATGGNVSLALKAASSYACYQSAQVFNSQLILLGSKSIHCLTIRFWRDRLDFFIKQNDYIEALQLAHLFFEGKGKAVIGLTGSIEDRKKVVGDEIVSILLLYLDMAMTVNCPKTSDGNSLSIYFRSLIPITIESCLLTGNLEILFNDIYERFVDDEIARDEFLEGLEPYILDNKLTYLTAIVIRDLIEHYEKSGKLEKLEKCLVHLDLASVDIDYLVKLCWNYNLYDLLINVYNKGLKDYHTPFEKLIKLVQEYLQNGSNSEMYISLGNKILVYLNCCLAGNQYPIGKIDDSIVNEVKEKIFNLLTKKKSELRSENSEIYPYIRTLLLFDTREFLNVLFIAFEEKEFESNNLNVAASLLSKRQKIIDILLEVMLKDKVFSPFQLGCLFTFIARQMAKQENSIRVSKKLFTQVLEFLTDVHNEKEHDEREQALIELFSAGGLNQYDDEYVLALAVSAKFYRVCEIIYSKKKQYQNVLFCYLRDPARQNLAFFYIDEMLSNDSFTDFEKEEFSVAVLDSMDKLVEINSIKFARLIIAHFPSSFNKVATNLNNRPEIQYMFLKGVFQDKPDLKSNKKNSIDVKSSIHVKFISLMCQYEPQCVYRYLQSAENYDLQEVLTIVQQEKLVNAASYLLERLGDVHGAFKVLCDDLFSKVQILDTCYREENMEDKVKNALVDVDLALKDSISLCERNSGKLDSDQREALWFPLLETVMAPQRHIGNTSSAHFLVFKELTKDVLTNMMAYISLPAILQKIMRDPAYNAGKFGEIKEFILGMLDTYNYELTLLETTNSLLGKDLYSQYEQEKKILSRGIRPSQYICILCARELNKDYLSGFKAILFRCGHVYHNSCLQGSVGFDQELVCVQCNKGSIARSRNHCHPEYPKNLSPKKPQGKNKTEQVHLSQQQIDALNILNSQSNESTFSILNKIINQSNRNLSSNMPYNKSFIGQSLRNTATVSKNDTFSLKLSPPF